MSTSWNANTAFDALDDTTYDLFDLDSYCLLSPTVSTPKPFPHTSPAGPRSKRYPKVRGHPRLSPPIVLSPPVASTTSLSPAIPAQSDKGKGHEHPTLTVSPTSSVDPPPSVSAGSVDLTPEQHLCLVQVLKRLDDWLAQGWKPGVDESHLWALAEVFNCAESVAEGPLSNIRRADLAWRLADSEGWEKSARSSIMGAIDIQVTITKILFKDYGEPLIASFRSFLGQKEAELDDCGRPSGIPGLSLLKEESRGNPKPDVPKRVRFQGLDGAVRGACDVRPERDEGGRLPAHTSDAHVPTYDEACKSLAQHLAFISGMTYWQWLDFLFTLRESAPGTNALRSRHASGPLPDMPFTPVVIDDQLRYLLVGCGCLSDTHPLRRFQCFRCNSLGHWFPDHDRARGTVYGGPAHSGILPGTAR